MLCVTDAVSGDRFVPKNPNMSDMNNVFDITFSRVQPYLFKVGG